MLISEQSQVENLIVDQFYDRRGLFGGLKHVVSKKLTLISIGPECFKVLKLHC